MVANKTSRFCWAYEGTPGSAAITAVDTTTYEFGEYNKELEKWNAPYAEHKTDSYYAYNSRTPILTELSREFPTFRHSFLPTTPQVLAWMLKNPSNADPSVNIGVLDTGYAYPITVRLEQKGGSEDFLVQAVGCQMIDLGLILERGKQMVAEGQWAWQSIEDHGDRPILTTTPVMPGMAVTNSYNGNPIVIWDCDGTPVNLTHVWRADIHFAQDHDIASYSDGTKQQVYLYKHQPIEIVLSAVFEADDFWDDYMDRIGTYEMSIQVKKQDNTSNILMKFINCRIENYKKTGHAYKGHYGAICAIKAEDIAVTNDWFTESGGGAGDFTTHFKGQVT